MIVYLYEALHTTEKSNKFYQSRFDKEQLEHKIKYLIYQDILHLRDTLPTSTKTKEKKFDTLTLKTKNSLHEIFYPNVAYFINEQTLFRVESNKKISLPITHENIDNYKIDKLLEDVEIFKVYIASSSFLFIIKTINGEKTIFEIDMPLPKPTTNNDTNSSNQNQSSQTSSQNTNQNSNTPPSLPNFGQPTTNQNSNTPPTLPTF